MKIKILFFISLISFFVLNAQKVYNFTLKDTDRQFKDYESLKGENLTIIDFWATWCKPCQLSIPKINKIYESYTDKGVNVIGINIDNPRNQAKIRPFIKATGIKYPILLDTEQEVMQEFNVTSIPILFIVDGNNEIVYIHDGYSPGDDIELQSKIEELLNSNH